MTVLSVTLCNSEALNFLHGSFSTVVALSRSCVCERLCSCFLSSGDSCYSNPAGHKGCPVCWGLEPWYSCALQAEASPLSGQTFASLLQVCFSMQWQLFMSGIERQSCSGWQGTTLISCVRRAFGSAMDSRVLFFFFLICVAAAGLECTWFVKQQNKMAGKGLSSYFWR